MQGYEYYVVDGVAGGYLKATLTREMFKFQYQDATKKVSETYNISLYGFLEKYLAIQDMFIIPQPGE